MDNDKSKTEVGENDVSIFRLERRMMITCPDKIFYWSKQQVEFVGEYM